MSARRAGPPEEQPGDEPSGSTDATARPRPSNYRLTALIIASALFMEFVDATVLVTALPTIARDFGVSAPVMSLALTSYLLALAIFIPASGSLADRYGTRRTLQCAICLFLIGSIACSQSTNLPLMAAARFVQGMGGALMMPVGRLILLRSVAKQDMISAMSWLLMPALIGPILGPPIGALIVTHLDWRWIFYLNVPPGLLALLLIGRYIPDYREKLSRRFDLRGFVLSAAGLGCLVFSVEAINAGGSAVSVACLFLGSLVAGALYVRHARGHIDPILDLSLLRDDNFRLSFIAGSLTRVTQGAQPFLLPLMMQVGFGFSAIRSGTITIATVIGSFAMRGVARHILRGLGFRWSMVVAGVLGTLSYASCSLFRPGWPSWTIFGVLAISGFFMSFQFTAYNTIAYDGIGEAKMSRATAFYSTLQQLMLSIGVCTGALALRMAMAINRHDQPRPEDFSVAFLVITGISFTAILWNLSFHADAGAQMSGHRRRGDNAATSRVA